MHEHEGFFCKNAILWIKDKIADLGKKLHGTKLAGPAVHRRGLGDCSHRATGLEAKKRLGFGRLGRFTGSWAAASEAAAREESTGMQRRSIAMQRMQARARLPCSNRRRGRAAPAADDEGMAALAGREARERR